MFLRGLHLLLQGGPVMGPLFLCAVLSLTLIIEGGLFFWRHGREETRERRFLVRSLPVLDTIITVAPLLGLLGTVTGMIKAFHLAGRAGLNNPSLITGGVAEALIATATGLLIAIVTLLGYNALSARLSPLRASGAGSLRRNPARGGIFKRARIEIIPMIDTIFFLLVFFMMTSLSMVQMHSRKVTLPVSALAHEKPQTQIIVTLTREGEYYLDYQRVSVEEIRSRLAARVEEDPQATIVINCDRDQPVAAFARLFDLVKQANAGTVVIATAPRTPMGGAPDAAP